MILEKLLKIHGKKYEWNEEMKKLTGTTGFHHGVIAQELQEEFPEMVSKGSDGYLRVDYIQLIPVMIEAIRELKNEIDQIKLNK
jgi:hypothetical protein